MINKQTIPLDQLFIDLLNPRFKQDQQDQLTAINNMAMQQGIKLFTLAKDIVDTGLSPADSILVMPSPETDHYTVLEGNRRVCALKILQDPQIIKNLVKPSIFEKYLLLSCEYAHSPIEEIECVVFDQRQDASHWILQRHTGLAGGKGLDQWNGQEKLRFRERILGISDASIHILQLLEDQGMISEETKTAVFPSTLGRIIKTSDVKKKLGLKISGDGQWKNPDEITEESKLVIAEIAKKIASKDITTGKVYSKGDRVAVFEKTYNETLNIPSVHLESEKQRENSNKTNEENTSDNSKRNEPEQTNQLDKTNSVTPNRSNPSSLNRNALIPRGFNLKITDTKTNDIFQELKKMPIQDYPNAVAVLFRSFLELSVYHAIETNFPEEELNKFKFVPSCKKVYQHFCDNKILNDKELKSLKIAFSNKLDVLAPETLNTYIHSKFVFPSPINLFSAWNNYQTFLQKIWEN